MSVFAITVCKKIQGCKFTFYNLHLEDISCDLVLVALAAADVAKVVTLACEGKRKMKTCFLFFFSLL